MLRVTMTAPEDGSRAMARVDQAPRKRMLQCTEVPPPAEEAEVHYFAAFVQIQDDVYLRRVLAHHQLTPRLGRHHPTTHPHRPSLVL